ncbi:UDP-N-acetylmuramoyl-tripeptide--D-alanyl-D-alanine ligase [Acuticoccus sp.]|uniref:UDP-N-acetylmuramoyl-tripeptide--D-alanyl-D- alanine ligase n=1 Tax=Acuticoccus sp. TaxID=1904378 RepID=UPI003B51D9A7
MPRRLDPLWTLGDLAQAAGGRLMGASGSTAVTGISIDTRTLQPGDAFFAISGVSRDAHEFVPDAIDAGASAAVISRGEAERSVVVDDVLAALGHVGVAARARLLKGTPVVAVTGSVGKTGTKEMLELALATGGPVHASAASYNNHWGVPLSLARMPADVDAAVFEIGMNHAGEITPLTAMVRPTIAIVTTVAAVHLAFFPSVAAIADAKAEIFTGLEDGGVAIVPSDNEHTDRLIEAAQRARAEVVTFGEGGDVSLVALDEAGAVEADVFGERVAYTLLEAAPHVANNTLAVLAALSVAGWDITEGARALGNWTAPRGRGRRVRLRPAGGEAILFDDCFNANPKSTGAAIARLGRTEARRRVVILGDMRELGRTAGELHRGLAPLLVDADVRIVHTVGTMTEELRDALPFDLRGEHVATADELLTRLPEVEPGDAILVKGSKAVGLAAVVDALERRYGLHA